MKPRKLKYQGTDVLKVVGKGELQPGQELDFSAEDSYKADQLLTIYPEWFEEVKLPNVKLGKKESETDNG